jgi:diguanylate cyclase (GGDEF)-like protein/PAS domain S-box-containing protein
LPIIWDIPLVLLSVLLATLGSLAALSHAQRMRMSSGRMARIWMLVGAVTLGSAIWSMHFIGMLALHLPIPIGYDPPLTVVSALPAIAAASLAFFVLREPTITLRRIVLSSLLMGVGISAMHYTGMAAIQMSPPFSYNPLSVTASIFVACVASLGAILMMYRGKQIKMSPLPRFLLGGAMMGLAISGMHYTSLLGLQFMPGSVCLSYASGIGRSIPVIVVSLVSLLWFGVGLLAAMFDQRMARQNAQALAQLETFHLELQTRTNQLAEAQGLAHIGSWELDLTSGKLRWSDEIFRLFEINKEQFGATYEAFLEAIHPVDRIAVNQAFSDALLHRRQYDIVHRLRMKDGRIKWVHERGTSEYDAAGNPTRSAGTVQDITERMQHEAELKTFKAIIESSDDAILSKSLGGIIKSWNHGAEEIFGYSPAEAIGNPITLIIPPECLEDEVDIRQRISRGEKINHMDSVRRHKDGRLINISATISPILDEGGEVVGTSNISRNITERKQMEEQIRQLAFYDPLTNLPNRRLLLDRCEQALRTSDRHKSHGAVLFLDLNRFKVLNDTKGHEVGDMLLVEVARRLLSCVRAEDTVARMGGDEFVVVLEALSPQAQIATEQAAAVAEKIRTALDAPYVLSGHTHSSSASIGIWLFNGSDQSVNELLTHADKAMYQAKSAGRNPVRVFNE